MTIFSEEINARLDYQSACADLIREKYMRTNSPMSLGAKKYEVLGCFRSPSFAANIALAHQAESVRFDIYPDKMYPIYLILKEITNVIELANRAMTLSPLQAPAVLDAPQQEKEQGQHDVAPTRRDIRAA